MCHKNTCGNDHILAFILSSYRNFILYISNHVEILFLLEKFDTCSERKQSKSAVLGKLLRTVLYLLALSGEIGYCNSEATDI